jgi:hypothetical protein
MSSSRDAVRCTVHDGAMLIHLDDLSAKVPPQLVSKSQVLVDALSVTDPPVTRKITLSVPKEWMRAWAVCYCNEDERLICDDIKDLINCLLVCFSPWIVSPTVLTIADCAATIFTAGRVLRRTRFHFPITTGLFLLLCRARI